MKDYFTAGHRILPLEGIKSIDTYRLEQHEVTVKHTEGTFVLTGADAINLVMTVKPSALEGRRLRWVRHSWFIHNTIGHPMMQVLAFFGFGHLGVKLHDLTTPRPQTEKR